MVKPYSFSKSCMRYTLQRVRRCMAIWYCTGSCADPTRITAACCIPDNAVQLCSRQKAWSTRCKEADCTKNGIQVQSFLSSYSMMQPCITKNTTTARGTATSSVGEQSPADLTNDGKLVQIKRRCTSRFSRKLHDVLGILGNILADVWHTQQLLYRWPRLQGTMLPSGTA